MHRLVPLVLVCGAALGCDRDLATAGETTASNNTGPTLRDATGQPRGEAASPEPTVDTEALSVHFEEIELEGPADFITDFVFVPGTDEFIAASKSGTVFHFALGVTTARLLGSFQLPNIYSPLDCGLISLAFDPDYESNGFLYAGACVDIEASGIFRFKFDPDNYASIAATRSEVIVLRWEDSERPWHNVGALSFDANGTLWAPFGEKTGPDNSQDLTNALGALVRIIPNRDPDGSGYEPAPDNPFVDESDKSPEIYAYGLRSPWRGALDHRGRYWVGDVGSDYFEEINVITQAAQNFGWPRAEGYCQGDCNGLTDPLFSWGRRGSDFNDEDPESTGLINRVAYVGLEYRPEVHDRYQGKLTDHVLFGDYCLGYVRAAKLDTDDRLVANRHIGHLHHASAWRQGPDDYIYAATFGRCVTNAQRETDDKSRFYRAVLD